MRGAFPWHGAPARSRRCSRRWPDRDRASSEWHVRCDVPCSWFPPRLARPCRSRQHAARLAACGSAWLAPGRGLSEAVACAPLPRRQATGVSPACADYWLVPAPVLDSTVLSVTGVALGPMAKLDLSVAVGDYDRTRPLLDGSVQIDGVNPILMTLSPEEIFFRAF